MINTLPVGHILQNEYKIEKVLGAGGFGITYLARDTSLNYLVVIKEFLPQDMATRDQSRISVTPFTKDTNTYNHLLKRFSEEAQLLAKMRHPNIVKVTRFFKANNTAYFVMEYAEGETLKEYLQRHNTMNEEEILSVMMPILEGTKYVHSIGFLHRDIAPDNIYLTKNGMPILIDFGAARDAIAEKSKNISSIVKEGYSSPEQYTVNNKQNASSDIYALGSVFYRMITGKVPPNAPHRQTALLNDELDPMGDLPVQYKSKYSQKLLHAVTKSMNIRAADRFASVSQFQNALTGTSIVDSHPSPTLKQGKNKTNEDNKKSDKNVSLIAFVIVIFILIAGIGYMYIGQKIEPVAKSKITDPQQTKVSSVSPSSIDTKNAGLEKTKRELAEVKRQKEEAQRQHNAEIERQKQETETLRIKAGKLKITNQQVTQSPEPLLRKGKDYYHGTNGVKKNYLLAKEYFTKAAKKDISEAYRYLGVMYLFGNGVVVDKTLASELLHEAVRLGDIRAKDLYECYVENSDIMKYKIDNLLGKETLSVREQPTTTTRKIDEIVAKIGVVTILDTSVNSDSTEWSKIKYCRKGSPRYGWVASRYLVPAYSSYSNTKHYKIIHVKQNDTLNMRSGPGSEYQKIGELASSSSNLTLLQCTKSTKGGRWCKIKQGTQEGWVSALYLKEQ